MGEEECFLGEGLGLGGIYILSFSTGVEHSVTAVPERNIAPDFFLVGVIGGRNLEGDPSLRLREEFLGVEPLRRPPDELLGGVAGFFPEPSNPDFS